MNLRILPIVISCLLACSPIYGADNVGTLKGIVKDPNGAIIAKTAIFVRRNLTKFTPEKPPQQDLALWTDQTARFAIQLEPGFYDVCAYSSAFSPGCQTLKLAGGQITSVELRLEVSVAITAEYEDQFAPDPAPASGKKDK